MQWFCTVERVRPHTAQRAAGIVSDEGVLDGEPRIEGRRIGVLQVHEEVEEDVSPRAFADQYGLAVATVSRALAYYHEHPAEMRGVRERRRGRIEDVRDDALAPEDVE